MQKSVVENCVPRTNHLFFSESPKEEDREMNSNNASEDKGNKLMDLYSDSSPLIESMLKAVISNETLDSAIMWRCFEFCYLFPKNYEFFKDDIVQLWIVEGFIPSPQAGINIEAIASIYFDTFQGLSIFHLLRFDYFTGRQRYKLNDSVFDHLQKQHNDEYFRLDDDGSFCISDNTVHSSLHDGFNPINFSELYRAKRLCTLFILHQHGYRIDQLPRDLFIKLPLLWVLDLSHTSITDLPSSIGNLKALRYLNLSGTPIRLLPKSFCSLYQIQVLKLRDCSKLVGLPKEMRKLTKLRHLDVDVPRLLVSMPPGFGDLTELQTLPAFVVCKEIGYHINELKHMVNLHGALCILRLENVFSLEEAKDAALDQKRYLDKLELQWSELRDGFELLENLQPHTNLKELQIVGYGGAKFPSWIGNHRFSKLVNITIHDCKKCKFLSPFGKLPLLKSLSVSEMHEVKAIDHQFCGRNMDLENLDLEKLDLWTVSENLVNDNVFTGFPRLENLTLNGMPKLEKWSGIVEGDFPQLQKLNIFGCLELTGLPQLSLLDSMQKLEIRLCPLLESFPMDGLPNSLQDLVIIDCPVLKERCQKEVGEEWRKLAQIPSVWMDDEQFSWVRSSEFLGKEDRKKKYTQLSEIEAAESSKTESSQASYDVNQQLLAHGRNLEMGGSGKHNVLEGARGSEYPKSGAELHMPEGLKTGEIAVAQHLRKRKNEDEKETVRVAASQSGNIEIPPDDGFTWHRYGQKAVRGSKFERIYYRCIHRYLYGCSATKQVQRLDNDPHMFEVTYRGHHVCQISQTASPLRTTLEQQEQPLPPSPSRSTSSPNPQKYKKFNQMGEIEFVESSVAQTSPRRKHGHENRTVRVATAQSGIPPDDGFSWRKYGQKEILDPRSYYGCTNKGCPARKIVQRLEDDPDTFEIVYSGHHTCHISPTELSTATPLSSTNTVMESDLQLYEDIQNIMFWST